MAQKRDNGTGTIYQRYKRELFGADKEPSQKSECRHTGISQCNTAIDDLAAFFLRSRITGGRNREIYLRYIQKSSNKGSFTT